MKAQNFDLKQYCQRIGLSEVPTVVDANVLRTMMQAQLRTITFENLDVQAGKIVSLVPEDIVNKIVGSDGQAKRGGYCYELNGLFAMALTALGVDYQFVFCRPMFYPMRRPKTHMALVVTVEQQKFLCDLGFGSYGMRAPIALADVNITQQQDWDSFRLAMPDAGQYILQAYLDNQWVNQFGFDLYPADWIDFMPANYLNSTHPDTIFVQKLLLIRQTDTGRNVLIGHELKRTERGVTSVQTLEPDELAKAITEVFGLKRPV
jgi:N-hydroxyarylamine O-acetyltransferase